MSGTLGAVRREQQKMEKFRHKQNILAENRQQIIAEICAAFNWQTLEPFAKEMIDRALDGQVVDVEQLKIDLDVWKNATETENTENAGLSL